MATNELTQHAEYLRSVDNVRNWLKQSGMGSKIFLLVQNGYDDIDSMARCNDFEANEFGAIFDDNEVRNILSNRLNQLRMKGYAPEDKMYKNSKSSISYDSEKQSYGYTEAQISKPHTSKTMVNSDSQSQSFQSESNKSRLQAKLGVLCPGLHGNEWVERFFVLHDHTLWCYLSSMDNRPEMSINMANPKIRIVHQEQTQLIIEVKGQQRLKLEFGRADLAQEWRDQFHSIQTQNLAKLHTTSQMEKNKRYQETLKIGDVFKKVKKGKALRRRIWCTPALDKIMWGSPDESDDVRGFLPLSHIHEIDAELSRRLRIYILSDLRTLILEAPSLEVLSEWVRCLKFAVEQRDREKKEDDIRLSDPGYRRDFEMQKKAAIDLFRTGQIFTKFRHGKGLTRNLCCDGNMEFLQWKDEERNRVKGQLAFLDVAYAKRDATQGELGMLIVARKRNLELKAHDVATRDRWIDGINFWSRFMFR